MTKEQRKELEARREKFLSYLSPISSDYIFESEVNDKRYLSDAFAEFADGCVSVYYSDKHKYYEDNAAECEAALLDYYDSAELADIIKNEGLYYLICKAGAVGQFAAIERELYNDKEQIITVLLIEYLLQINSYLSDDELEEIVNRDYDCLLDFMDDIIKAVSQ